MKYIAFVTLILCFGLEVLMAQPHDYPYAQHISTYFLGGQRCGDTQSWIHPEAACHTTDGQIEGVDLEGGWHDCGDYIKFHATGPYCALINLYGYDKFPEAYPDNYSQAFSAPPSNGIPDIIDEVKIETDYLIKCVRPDKIYYQVGDGDDHNSFSDPVTNSSENLYNGSHLRTLYSATEGQSNSFGNAAAALALMSILYEPYSTTYADSCLQAAIRYYDTGKINSAAAGDATAFAYGFMDESDYEDEMGMGAVMLYRATNIANYLTEAESYASGLNPWNNFSYVSLNPVLFYELYQQTNTQTYLNNIGNVVGDYTLESCGYYHYSNWGSMRDASNSALLACLYHSETDDATAYSFAKSNIDFILGSHDAFNNVPANFSFLIGYNVLGGGYPERPHHGASFGASSNAWTQYTNETNNPGSVEFAYELTGGLAGGPESACGMFENNINNYVSNEFCSYYNSAFTSAVAYINKIENNIILQKEDNAPVNTELLRIINNPVKDELKVFSQKTVDIVIYDVSGRGYSPTRISIGENSIDLSNIKTGIYFLHCKELGFTNKVIKL